MQFFVPESRRAEIVVEVGRMEERQAADSIEDRRLRQEPGLEAELNCGEDFEGKASITSEPAHAPGTGRLSVVAESVDGAQRSEEHRVKLTHPGTAAKTDRQPEDIEFSEVGASELQEMEKEGTEVLGRSNFDEERRKPLTASQEQEDILEAWRKRRRQEMAALEGAPVGGHFHKRGSELGQESAGTPLLASTLGLGVSKSSLQGGEQKQAAESRTKSVQSMDEEDEELLKKLRTK